MASNRQIRNAVRRIPVQFPRDYRPKCISCKAPLVLKSSAVTGYCRHCYANTHTSEPKA